MKKKLRPLLPALVALGAAVNPFVSVPASAAVFPSGPR